MLCFNSKKVGYVKKTHGIKGEVVVEFDFPIPENFKLNKWVFLKHDGILIPFMVEWYKILNENSIILRFVNYEDIDSIKIFISSEFHVESNIEWLSNVKISFLNLANYKIFDTEQNYLGIIKEVLPIKNNPVVEVDKDNKSVLFPFHENLIQSVDHNSKSIILKLLEKNG